MILIRIDREVSSTHGDLEDLLGIDFKSKKYFNYFNTDVSNDHL